MIQLICPANKFTNFYKIATLPFKGTLATSMKRVKYMKIFPFISHFSLKLQMQFFSSYYKKDKVLIF